MDEDRCDVAKDDRWMRIDVYMAKDDRWMRIDVYMAKDDRWMRIVFTWQRMTGG